ncbi:ribose-phosphate diphosphokinase [Polluticaenibacter yanchengensis]|uniref:Ribose-phosphate diphosphokinase n=1 Tax=Polluticaenibacter yanchengensis TaxID=3014562 RepID=A0ABT4UNZ0_9BACT|nr:ribose-phosphate diphosphokinase [Chitinophagaceae bacterium LY-5]
MILNLDRNFKPLTGNEITFESFTFSGGEPHIKIAPQLNTEQSVTITHRLNSFNDLGLLCLAVDALKRMGIVMGTLIIPYFPAARQDRLMVKGEPLTVKVYAEIINGLGFNKVIILDPHSEVTPALLNNCDTVPNHAFIKKVIEIIDKPLYLVSPDGGALKKIYKVSEFLNGIEVIECSKSRDVKTGKLKEFIVYANDIENKDCLIVDDICDGGGTFIGLAEELKKKGAGKLYLAVTHGIFSKGFEGLDQYFEQIFTTNSIKEMEHHKITQIQLNNGLLSCKE